MIRILLLFAGLFYFSACATHQSRITPAQQDIRSGRCAEGLAQLESLLKNKSDDQLLYLMEYGSALQICKDYSKSKEIFIQADKLSEEIDYTSLSRVLGATLLNEEMIQYKGDRFEKLFINALNALNFIELGQLDDAMVEVRRINEKAKKFAEQEKMNFELNSFSQYLSGLIYENQKKYDDACIAYKEAFKLDPSYRAVGIEMLTACWRAHRTQEFKTLSKEMKATEDEISYAKRKIKDTNEIVIVFLQGWGPRKTQSGETVSHPYLTPSFSATKKLIVSGEGESTSISFSKPVYSVEKAAIATLQADSSSLAGRRFGARVAKEVMADQIRQKDKALGDIAWLIMVASERADLRNWTMLPESIQIVRLNVDNTKALRLSGRNMQDQESEDLGRIDLTTNPGKEIFLVRSIK